MVNSINLAIEILIISLCLLALLGGLYTMLHRRRVRANLERRPAARPLDPGDNWLATGQHTFVQRPATAHVRTEDRPATVASAAHVRSDGNVETSGFYKKSTMAQLGSWYGKGHM